MSINAIEMNWRVEIWAWRHSCSSRFPTAAALFPERMTIRYLDDIVDDISFKAKTVAVTKKHTTGNAKNDYVGLNLDAKNCEKEATKENSLSDDEDDAK